MQTIHDNEIFGFIRPRVDAHTLGIAVISSLLKDCGYRVCIGSAYIAEAVDEIQIQAVEIPPPDITVSNNNGDITYNQNVTNINPPNNSIYGPPYDNNFANVINDTSMGNITPIKNNQTFESIGVNFQQPIGAEYQTMNATQMLQFTNN